MSDADLANMFHQAMLGVYHDAKRLAGYNATYFYRMVLEHGGVETAHRLLSSNQISSGLAELWHKGHLEISMENLACQPRFQALFDDDERAVARRRLVDLGFAPR